MRFLMGLVVASGILIGTAAKSEAQFSISIGNPYTGQGLSIGNPGYGYNNYGYSGYSGYGIDSGYANAYNSYSNSAFVAGNGNFNYSSGYAGYAPIAGYAVSPYGIGTRPYGYGGNPYGYQQNRPYYGSYGYGNYNYGSRDGFRPFGGGRMFR